MKYIINLIWSNKMWIFSEAFHSQVWHEYNWNYDQPFKFDPKFYQKMLILSEVAKDAMDRIHPKVAKDAPTRYPPYICTLPLYHLQKSTWHPRYKIMEPKEPEIQEFVIVTRRISGQIDMSIHCHIYPAVHPCSMLGRSMDT